MKGKSGFGAKGIILSELIEGPVVLSHAFHLGEEGVVPSQLL